MDCHKTTTLQTPASETSSKEDSRIGHPKASTYAHRIIDHVKLGPNLSETVKGKIRLGAKIVKHGGRYNIFKETFGVIEGEEVLLKASLCYLSTTSGPIPGLLFISTHKIAFSSDTCVPFHSPTGDLLRTPYKVLIPIRKIKTASQSENMEKPEQKYIEIVTEDDFEFWFMGFLRYEKAFINLHNAVSMAQRTTHAS